MTARLGRVILYTRRMEEVEAFYTRHFGYAVQPDPEDRIRELRPPGDGAAILLHPAGKGQRAGQSLLKLVFDVADVAAARARLIDAGVEVGPIHEAQGYLFANLKDPAGNAVSLSSRAFREG